MLKDVNDNEYKKYLYGKYLVSFDIKKLKHIHDDKEYSDLNELLHVLDELEKASEVSKSEPISVEKRQPHFESNSTETTATDSTTTSPSNSIAELENKVRKHPKVTLYTVSGKTCYRYKGKTYEDPREVLSKIESERTIFGNIKNYIATNTDFDDRGLWIGLGVVLSIPIIFFSFLSLNSTKKDSEYVDTYQVSNTQVNRQLEKEQKEKEKFERLTAEWRELKYWNFLLGACISSENQNIKSCKLDEVKKLNVMFSGFTIFESRTDRLNTFFESKTDKSNPRYRMTAYAVTGQEYINNVPYHLRKNDVINTVNVEYTKMHEPYSIKVEFYDTRGECRHTEIFRLRNKTLTQESVSVYGNCSELVLAMHERNVKDGPKLVNLVQYEIDEKPFENCKIEKVKKLVNGRLEEINTNNFSEYENVKIGLTISTFHAKFDKSGDIQLKQINDAHIDGVRHYGLSLNDTDTIWLESRDLDYGRRNFKNMCNPTKAHIMIDEYSTQTAYEGSCIEHCDR